jgi:hypothetical protein
MDAWCSTLGSADVHPASVKLDLMPLEAADLRRSQAVAIGGENHRAVAMTMPAVLASSVHEPLDLVFGEIAASNCEVLVPGKASRGKAFIAVYLWVEKVTVKIMALFFKVRLLEVLS